MDAISLIALFLDVVFWLSTAAYQSYMLIA